MGRPERPIDTSGGTVAMFATALRGLRAAAGNPTYRDMARTTYCSPSSLSTAASGYRLPTLPVVLAFVSACGGNVEEWRQRWFVAFGGAHAEPPRPGPSAPVPVSLSGLPRPAQLPLRPRRFVGRTAELRRLLVPATTPVVISGPVGVGKSGFALHYAYHVAADAVDGQIYADLGTPAAVRSVLAGFLTALGVPGTQLPETVDQRAGLYRSLLSEGRLVVLLDNVRDEQQVRPLLAETRGGVVILVSRNPLLGLRDLRRVRLDVLPRADSVAMIAAAAPERVAADPAGCDLLADLCGDLPLALDIAARKLDARPDIPLRHIIERLRLPAARLDWLRIGDLSVWDALNSAYEGLSEPAVQLLYRLIAAGPRSTVDADDRHPMDDELFAELADAGMARLDDRPGSCRVDSLARAFVMERTVSVPTPEHNGVRTGQPRGLIVSHGQLSRSNSTAT